MAKPSCSDGKKRSRDEETHPEVAGLGAESNFTYTDTLVALRMMHAQFPRTEKVVLQPFTLQSQLYSSIKDRTQVDRDLELLKKERILRLFKLNTGTTTNGMVTDCDMLEAVDLALNILLSKFSSLYIEFSDESSRKMNEQYKRMNFAVKKLGARNQHDVDVFEWFKMHVIESKLDTSIGHQELTRQMIDPNTYWFSIPNIGFVLKFLTQGRKELLSFLNRRKYKEMLLAPLEKKCLRLSPLGMRFHLRDLIGSGHIKLLQSPSGMLVRASKD